MSGQRYTYRQVFTAQEWFQVGALVVRWFESDLVRQCQIEGYPLPPADSPLEVVGRRINSEGARDDRGELLHRIECDPADPRVVEVELRVSWVGEQVTKGMLA